MEVMKCINCKSADVRFVTTEVGCDGDYVVYRCRGCHGQSKCRFEGDRMSNIRINVFIPFLARPGCRGADFDAA